ncbi:two-component regulator propeller domain-containing protein [Gracilimonas sp.]|uniref:sensor histidine kinase n=1 Tax=Gracilimonas sp. TaxID=1974203 RepID=UPI003BA8C2AF
MFILLAIPLFSEAQNENFENYVVTQFGLEEGLPQSSVNDIIQAGDGYIWLATYGGLVRFDGLSFTTFNRSNTPGMVEERILNILEDSEGSIWIISEDPQTPLLRYKNGEVQDFPIDRSSVGGIRLQNAKDGTLLMTSSEKLLKFNGVGFQRVDIIKPDSNESENNYEEWTWLNLNKKIVLFKDNKAIEVADFSDEFEGNFEDSREYPAGSGELILATRSEGFYKYADNKISPLPIDDGMEGLIFNTFGNTNSDAEELYIELIGHVAVWYGSELKLFKTLQYNSQLNLKGVLKDSEGNLWFGTDASGLFKVRPSAIQMIDKDQGLSNERMLSLTMLDDGTGLFSTNCGGIYEWRGGKAYSSKVQEFYHSGCNWSVFQDSKGRIWIGGGGVYVTRSLNEEGIFYGEAEGFTNVGVLAMMEDRDENIWVASTDGLYVNDGEKFVRTYTEEDGLYYNDVRSLLEDEDGIIWVGTSNGLNTIQNNEVRKIPLIGNSEISAQNAQPNVRAIYQDNENYMWIGTYGEGLFRVNGDEVQQLTTTDGLFDNVVSHIVEDEYGYFWMGSNRGISRVKRKDLVEYLDGNADTFVFDSFGSNDGMNSAETNGGFQPNAVKDSTGRIYFPTIAGVAVVDPSKVARNAVPPPVYIEGLRTEEREIAVEDTIVLSYNTAFLEVSYTGINFTDPEKVQFKYRMDGLDDDWIDVGNSRSALYSKIPPGEYIFQVIAGNSDGVWNTTGASLMVTVIPPFWQTSWFYSLVALSIIGVAGCAYYVRIEQLKRQNERQKRFTEQLIESEEKERKRIASELHDSLGQQILVIKNRAELARNFVENPDELGEQLDEIMQSATLSIEEVRSISHDLRPVHLERFGLTDAVRNLCVTIQETSALDWAYHVDDIDGVIPMKNEIHFYRVIQEGVNNILKHAKASQASVIIKIRPVGLTAVLWDNGIGFKVGEKKNMAGLGLSGMDERIETLGGTIDVQSAEGEGTTIKIVIPVKEWAMT